MPSRLRSEIRQRKAFASLEEEIFVGLQRTATTLLAGFSSALTASSVSPAQYNVLRILRGAGREGLACGAIWERMVTRDPDLTRLLDRLEARALVNRTRSRKDRRVVVCRITARGLKLLSGLTRPVADSHRKALGHMSRASLRMLTRLLDEVRDTALEPTRRRPAPRAAKARNAVSAKPR
jgi:DNA-binding MarR family transcriptional regulator